MDLCTLVIAEQIPEKRRFGSPLSDAWGQFISQFHFDWFLTMTFRESKHPEAANKLWRVFTNDLNKKLFGRRWMRKAHGGVHWFRGLEWQRRDVIHYHGLMGSPTGNLNSQARRLDWMDHWNDLAGFAKIEAVANPMAVALYISKYVAKGGRIDLSDNLAAPRELRADSN